MIKTMQYVSASALFAAATIGAASDVAAANTTVPAGIPTSDVTNLARHGFFYVGGKYVGEAGKQLMDGQTYVEVLVPKEVRRPYPLVLIHGAAQTATNWMLTPDGRKGWADYFVEQGYIIYMVDQPARGRSAYHSELDGAQRSFSAPAIEGRFTAPEGFGLWPQAKKHTQWPGTSEVKGRMGDAAFDAFDATQVDYLASNADTQRLNQEAGAGLLDKIGPAIVLTHSQSGPFGWLIADARPEKVKGIIAMEPSGPPFEEAVVASGKARPWGPTEIALTYDPPVKDPAELAVEKEATADGPDLVACWKQKEPARKLANLQGIPIMIAAAEASYHAAYDHCTAKYLAQAGAKNSFVRLEEHDITGNGHMIMLEKNNLEIAKLVDDWVVANVK